MGARRFKHFQESLGIAKNTLANRLGQLVDAGILEKAPASDGSAFDAYVLTERGRDLAPMMIALSQWGDKWAPHEEGPSTEIIDPKTGCLLPPIQPRSETGKALSLADISFRRSDKAPPLAWVDDLGPPAQG